MILLTKKVKINKTLVRITNIITSSTSRHVPIVGSFYNWLSPLPDEAKVKGRCLNLKEGKLESTESIYKHHMQVSR